MGTELQKRGLSQDPAILNLTHPEAIIEIHQQYLKAGANIITANTFGAYTHKHSNAADIIKAAMSHAQTALADYPGTYLALDLGPTGLMLEPYGEATPDELLTLFKEAVAVGASSGASLILIETMMDINELELAITAAKETALPICATMTFDKNGRTMMGTSIKDMVQALDKLGIAAIGMNCGFGPDIYANLAPELKSLTNLPIIMQPNAGMPVVTEGSTTPGYDLTIEDFVNAVVSMEVDIMGGCCGTSPQHISALVQRFR